MTDAEVAEIAHEANRALQRVQGEIVNFPWESTSQALRDSALQGVEKAREGLSPAEMHANWCAYKTAEGWVYGPVKDFAAKTHPCLVPYGDLPADQQVKDSLFSAVVRALI